MNWYPFFPFYLQLITYMNLNKTLTFSVIFILMYCSCSRYKSINYEIPFEGKKLVFYGFIGPDKPLEAQLLQNDSILTNPPNFSIDTATVVLYKNDVAVDTLVKKGALFKSNAFAKAGEVYHINAWNGKENKITSHKVQVPDKVTIDDFKYTMLQDSSIISASFNYSDLLDELNYYNISIEHYKEGKRLLHVTEKPFEAFQNVLSDKELEGNKGMFSEEIERTVYAYDSTIQWSALQKSDKIIIKLYHVTESVYQYYEWLHNSSNNLGDPYSQSLPVWTNIEGGYGVLGAYNVDSVVINL